MLDSQVSIPGMLSHVFLHWSTERHQETRAKGHCVPLGHYEELGRLGDWGPALLQDWQLQI